MVMIEQFDHCLRLWRGEQTLVLPVGAAAQQLAAALVQLGVTARRTPRTDQAAPHPHAEEYDDRGHA